MKVYVCDTFFKVYICDTSNTGNCAPCNMRQCVHEQYGSAGGGVLVEEEEVHEEVHEEVQEEEEVQAVNLQE